MYVCIINDYDIFWCPTRRPRFVFVSDDDPAVGLLPRIPLARSVASRSIPARSTALVMSLVFHHDIKKPTEEPKETPGAQFEQMGRNPGQFGNPQGSRRARAKVSEEIRCDQVKGRSVGPSPECAARC